MHNFHKHIFQIFSLGALGLLPAAMPRAAEFEEGIPQSLVEQFTQGRIYAGLPVDFPSLDFPDTLTVMGSLDNNFNQVVVFQTTEPVEEATAALVDSLFDAGWIQLASFQYEPPTNGFVSTTPPTLPIGPDEQYCHDAYGTLTISPGTGDTAQTLLNVRLANMALMQPGFSCRQQNEQREMQRNRGPGFPFAMQNRQYMPRLVLPEEETSNRAPFAIARMGGLSGSSDDFETNSRVSVDWSVEELNEHFATQLEEQGWTLDSDWSGEVSAGGNWTLSPETDLEYIGILTILKRNDRIHELKFRMVTRNAGSGGNIVDGFFTR